MKVKDIEDIIVRDNAIIISSELNNGLYFYSVQWIQKGEMINNILLIVLVLLGYY
jgi:hypothetical protein